MFVKINTIILLSAVVVDAWFFCETTSCEKWVGGDRCGTCGSWIPADKNCDPKTGSWIPAHNYTGSKIQDLIEEYQIEIMLANFKESPNPSGCLNASVAAYHQCNTIVQLHEYCNGKKYSRWAETVKSENSPNVGPNDTLPEGSSDPECIEDSSRADSPEKVLNANDGPTSTCNDALPKGCVYYNKKEGWVAVTNAEYGTYYWNRNTDKTQWDAPKESEVEVPEESEDKRRRLASSPIHRLLDEINRARLTSMTMSL